MTWLSRRVVEGSSPLGVSRYLCNRACYGRKTNTTNERIKHFFALKKLSFCCKAGKRNPPRLRLSDGWIIASGLSCVRYCSKGLRLGLIEFRHMGVNGFKLRKARTGTPATMATMRRALIDSAVLRGQSGQDQK